MFLNYLRLQPVDITPQNSGPFLFQNENHCLKMLFISRIINLVFLNESMALNICREVN